MKLKPPPKPLTAKQQATKDAWLRTQRDRQGIYDGWYFENDLKPVTNMREHFMARKRRVEKGRAMGCMIGKALIAHGVKLPTKVKFTRYSSRLLDSDNLPTAFKDWRDGIADAFGVNDNTTSPLQFDYAQEKSPRGTWGVRVGVSG